MTSRMRNAECGVRCRRVRRGAIRAACRTHHPAFTLTELLVVMGIILITITLGVPGVRAMFNAGRVDNSVKSIAGSITAARAHATRDKGFLLGEYSGVAIVFTPANELRLVENDEAAVDGSNNRLETKNPSLNGYTNVPEAQVVGLPSSVGVVGIARGNALKLYPPPFAIRFNQHGTLISGQNAASNSTTRGNIVYYDGWDFDGRCDLTRDRDAQQDISAFDPTSDSWNATNYDTDNGYKLPFEALEAVIGVIIFDKEAWRQAGFDWDDVDGDGVTGSDSNETTSKGWILNNGQAMLFNRYTGTVNE